MSGRDKQLGGRNSRKKRKREEGNNSTSSNIPLSKETKRKQKKKRTIFIIHFHFHFRFVLIEERGGGTREGERGHFSLHFQREFVGCIFPGRQRKRNADVAHAFPALTGWEGRGAPLSLRQKGVRGVFFSGAVDTYAYVLCAVVCNTCCPLDVHLSLTIAFSVTG